MDWFSFFVGFYVMTGIIVYGAFMLSYFDKLLEGHRNIPVYIWAVMLSFVLILFVIFWPSIFVARWFGK